MRKAYQRWAPVYDIIYDKLTEPAARAAVRAVEACGPRILEVGVGTGLSLGYYAPSSEVHGIDLSEDMLARARRWRRPASGFGTRTGSATRPWTRSAPKASPWP